MMDLDMRSQTPPTAQEWDALWEYLERQKALREKVTCKNLKSIKDLLEKSRGEKNRQPIGIPKTKII